MMYKAEICTSIKSIGEETWDSLNTYFTNPLLAYGWVNSVEMLYGDQVHPRHIVIYKNEKIVLILPCYIQYGDLYKTTEDCFFGRFKPLARTLGISLTPSLIVYSPFSQHSGLLSAQKEIDAPLFDLIEKTIDDLCNKERISLSGFPYLSNKYDFLIDRLLQRGYAKAFISATAYLDIRWKSFDEYLQHLKTYGINMFKNAKKEINRFKKSGVEVKTIDDFSSISHEMIRIYNDLYYRYNKQNSCLTPQFFEVLSKEKLTRAITAHLNGKLIGFSLVVEKGTLWDLKFSAHDVSEQQRTHSYFNLMFYQPIELAIQEGIGRVTFGAGSLRAKLKRGCKTESLFFVAKHRDSFYNSMLRFYLKGVGYVYRSKHRRQCSGR